MPLRMILLRMWRERRAMGVLLLAVCLVTGFLALGPLYARAVAEVAVRHLIAEARPEQLNVAFVNPAPWDPSLLEDAILPNLSEFVPETFRYAFGTGNVQGMICGFEYTTGARLTDQTPRTTGRRCYKPYSYAQPKAVFDLVEGRWPEALDAVPGDPYIMDEPHVEAILGVEPAAEAGLSVGSRFVLGMRSDQALTVEVVGLVEPALPPDDVFWSGQNIVLSGVWTPVGLERRYDIAPVFDEAVYDGKIAPLMKLSNYFWWLRVDSAALTGSTFDALDARLRRTEEQMKLRHPKLKRLTGLDDLIARFRADVRAVEGPGLLLSGMVLVLMLYNLATIVALVLARQRIEWATMSGRGAGAVQLVRMQFVTAGLLGVVGFALGPPAAFMFLQVLARIGPLAAVAGDNLGVSLPPEAIALSFAAAVAATLALTLPAWSAARQSVQALHQHRSRPPVRPVWARYFLDVVLLLVGVGFVLRLYFLSDGEVGTDPFNLAGPVLLLVGAALFWLRLFPLLMRAAGGMLRWAHGLTAPLALWNVARDPGHYAQLVLLLIGTLALGTASLAVGATHDAGAWETALQETGAHVSVSFGSTAGGLPEWESLDGVVDATPLMYVEEMRQSGQRGITLLGVDVDALEPLAGAVLPPRDGLLLPAGAEALTLQVYAMLEGDGVIETRLGLALADARGVIVDVPMTTGDFSSTGRFVTYQATLEGLEGREPWRLIGLHIRSKHSEKAEFEHTIYIDELTVHSPDGETVVEDFEDAPEAWILSINQTSRLLIMENDNPARAAQGGGSLHIRYRVTLAYSEPFVAVAQWGKPRVPVVVSEAFAVHVGQLTNDPPLKPGDTRSVDLAMRFGNLEFFYTVVGVVRSFPSQNARGFFMIAPIETLRAALNREMPPDIYDRNRVWLALAPGVRAPGEMLRAALNEISSIEEVTYAWDRYQVIQRAPLPNVVAGMLFAGFWVSLGLAVLDFGIYLAMSVRQRATSFAVLRAMGWDTRHIWGLLAIEQTALAVPALLVGTALGILLAYLLLPFLTLTRVPALQLPPGELLALLAMLLISFVALLSWTASALRRHKAHEILRE